jgi:hypothetical protein
MFEYIQWTMAYEFRGSMMVYLTLLATSNFTPSWRVAAYIFLTGYSIWFGNILGDIPFYSGVLLADLSLVINSNSQTTTRTRGLFRGLRNSWPMVLAFVALFISSYPPEGGVELAAWSRFLLRWGYIFLPSHCILPLYHFDRRGIHLGHAAGRFLALHFCNPLLAHAQALFIISPIRFSREHLLRHVSHSWISDAFDACVDYLWVSSGNGRLGQEGWRARATF